MWVNNQGDSTNAVEGMNSVQRLWIRTRHGRVGAKSIADCHRRAQCSDFCYNTLAGCDNLAVATYGLIVRFANAAALRASEVFQASERQAVRQIARRDAYVQLHRERLALIRNEQIDSANRALHRYEAVEFHRMQREKRVRALQARRAQPPRVQQPQPPLPQQPVAGGGAAAAAAAAAPPAQEPVNRNDAAAVAAEALARRRITVQTRGDNGRFAAVQRLQQGAAAGIAAAAGAAAAVVAPAPPPNGAAADRPAAHVAGQQQQQPATAAPANQMVHELRMMLVAMQQQQAQMQQQFLQRRQPRRRPRVDNAAAVADGAPAPEQQQQVAQVQVAANRAVVAAEELAPADDADNAAAPVAPQRAAAAGGAARPRTRRQLGTLDPPQQQHAVAESPQTAWHDNEFAENDDCIDCGRPANEHRHKRQYVAGKECAECHAFGYFECAGMRPLLAPSGDFVDADTDERAWYCHVCIEGVAKAGCRAMLRQHHRDDRQFSDLWPQHLRFHGEPAADDDAARQLLHRNTQWQAKLELGCVYVPPREARAQRDDALRQSASN
jgi:hypothetical protein